MSGGLTPDVGCRYIFEVNVLAACSGGGFFACQFETLKYPPPT